jgi:hypothetical protein
MLKASRQLSRLLQREISLAALIDERTLARALRGDAITSLSRERIRRALESRGIADLLPAEGARR